LKKLLERLKVICGLKVEKKIEKNKKKLEKEKEKLMKELEAKKESFNQNELSQKNFQRLRMKGIWS
jgi:hypothetical protein